MSPHGDGARLGNQAVEARDDRLFVALPIFLASGTRAGRVSPSGFSPALPDPESAAPPAIRVPVSGRCPHAAFAPPPLRRAREGGGGRGYRDSVWR
ncbi:hypothetical protein [Nocardia africana]